MWGWRSLAVPATSSTSRRSGPRSRCSARSRRTPPRCGRWVKSATERGARIARVRAVARAHVWSQIPGGLPESTFAGGVCQPGMVVLRGDGSLVVSHSKKDKAAPTFKKTFGHHPLGCWVDNTGELPALLLRPGNAGSNTAADLIAVIGEAITAVPKPWRAKLLVTSDGAGASH